MHRYGIDTVCRLAMFIVAGLGCAEILQAQTTSPVDTSPAERQTPVSPANVASGDRPLITTPLPGTSRNRLTSNQQYVSTLASFLGNNRSASTSQNLSGYYRSRSRANLLRIPEMFGDFRSPGNQWSAPVTTINSVQTEIPVAAGIGGLRIAEDNQALPADRFWISYNYFRNAFSIQSQGPGAGPGRSESLHRIVVAGEFLLDEGRTSIEIRMPFGSAINVADQAVPGAAATAFTLESDSVGNLSVILKRLIYADAWSAWSMGLGVETPTGSSASLTSTDARLVQEVDAVHLVPFLALTRRFDRWFGHAFAQIDVATGGDDLLGRLGPTATQGLLGEIDRAPLLGLDVGMGYWLKQPCCPGALGIAMVGELHHTTALGDGDGFIATDGALTLGINTPTGVADDLLNVTAGFVVSPGNGWSIRTAIVAPLRDERVFDSEAIFQLNRTF